MNVEDELHKKAINAYAVKNEVSQRCTEKAIQNPDATKREAEMVEHLIMEQLNYVRIKDALAVLTTHIYISKEQREEIADLLKPIVRKEGAFSRDQLTHAENCLELASENAQKVLKLLGGVEAT